MAELVERKVVAGGGEGGDKTGKRKYPTGFRFQPTDEELVEFYLLARLQGRPTVPNDAIIEANVYEFQPQTLISDMYLDRGEKAWYFLSPRARMYQNGVRPARKTEDGCGRWKSSMVSKEYKIGDRIKYRKNVLNYFVGTVKDEDRTTWLMREFSIPEYEIKRGSSGSSDRLDQYVLCKIYVSPVQKDKAGTSAAFEEAGEESRPRKQARQGSLTIGQAQASGDGNVSAPTRNAYNAQAPVQQQPIPMQFPPSAAMTYYPNFSGQMTTMTRPLNLGFPAPRTGFRPHVSLNCYYDHNYRGVQQRSNAVDGMPPQQRPMALAPRQQQQPYFNGNAHGHAGGVTSQEPPQQRQMASAPPQEQQIMYVNGNNPNDNAGASSSLRPAYNEGSSMAQPASDQGEAKVGDQNFAESADEVTGEQAEATAAYEGNGSRGVGLAWDEFFLEDLLVACRVPDFRRFGHADPFSATGNE